jgi:CheY-like chemotaxis protein
MTQTGGSQGPKLRALIADDVQETRRNTRLMLSTLGVEVVAIASNGLQAVEMAKEHHPDLVLLDINMPEMDGLTAYKHIALNHPDTGCIIISAESDAATLRLAGVDRNQRLREPGSQGADHRDGPFHLLAGRERSRPGPRRFPANVEDIRARGEECLRLFNRSIDPLTCIASPRGRGGKETVSGKTIRGHVQDAHHVGAGSPIERELPNLKRRGFH